MILTMRDTVTPRSRLAELGFGPLQPPIAAPFVHIDLHARHAAILANLVTLGRNTMLDIGRAVGRGGLRCTI